MCVCGVMIQVHLLHVAIQLSQHPLLLLKSLSFSIELSWHHYQKSIDRNARTSCWALSLFQWTIIIHSYPGSTLSPLLEAFEKLWNWAVKVLL